MYSKCSAMSVAKMHDIIRLFNEILVLPSMSKSRSVGQLMVSTLFINTAEWYSSRTDRSLYKSDVGAEYLTMNALVTPGWPTSWPKAAINKANVCNAFRCVVPSSFTEVLVDKGGISVPVGVGEDGLFTFCCRMLLGMPLSLGTNSVGSFSFPSVDNTNVSSALGSNINCMKGGKHCNLMT